jgi:hypothetical protein
MNLIVTDKSAGLGDFPFFPVQTRGDHLDLCGPFTAIQINPAEAETT